jgi:D-specific alpha-keto acid dehydrogenase
LDSGVTPARLGLTVYSCEPDEADLFDALAPRFGVLPTTTDAAVSHARPATACISVGHKSEIAAPTLRALRQHGVEYISTRSIGFDHIDLRAAEALGLTVENVAYAPDGVADFTVMLTLMAIRDAKDIVRAAERNDFRPPRVRGRDLRDLTVGVVGTGTIGTAVIDRLRGFGCRVLAYNSGRAADVTAAFVSLEQLLRESDIVTLHLPLNESTHHVIGREQIATMKHGAFLVNTGRGALVDTDALVVALEGGHLGGAALDVLEGEEGTFSFDCRERPIDNEHLLRLQGLPNVIITPHTAYYTQRALHDTVEQTLAQCRDYARNR